MQSRPLRCSAIVSAVVLAAVLWPGHAQAQGVTDRYDHTFRKYSKRFFGPAFDWRLFKAQAIVESNIDPTAKSRAGARGIMQLMPRTYREIRSKNPELVPLDDIERNIAAGIRHGRDLWLLWAADADEPHWAQFMLGSYNAGRGTVLRAQRVAELRGLQHRIWPTIEIVAPNVPRWRYEETINYVQRVQASLLRMDASGRIRER